MFNQPQTQSQKQTAFWRTVLRQFVPNLGTIIVVAAMLFVYNAQASSSNTPETPADPDIISGSIPYQGTLVDQNDSPVDGTVSMTFRLYTDPTGGTALWEETQSIEVNNGLFNAYLGSITPFSASMWEQPDLYLGIQISGDTEMMPRELVSGFPVAEMAMTVPDGTISNAWYLAPTTQAEIAPDTNWTDIIDTTQEFSLASNATVFFSYSINVQSVAAVGDDWVGTRLLVDGIPYASSGTHYQPRIERSNVNLNGNLVLDLGSGVHYVTLQWRSNGTTATWINYPDWPYIAARTVTILAFYK